MEDGRRGLAADLEQLLLTLGRAPLGPLELGVAGIGPVVDVGQVVGDAVRKDEICLLYTSDAADE